MEDDKPPIISRVVPLPGASIASRRPEIRARVSDTGSGVSEITATCGGQWLLMEYDPERQLIEWVRDEDLPAGEQQLVFRVSDRAGNVTTETRTLSL